MKKIESGFSPRIINPKKIKNVLILSAEEQIRKARYQLKEGMPWLEIRIVNDPLSLSRFVSNEATVVVCDDTALNFIDEKKLRRNCEDLVLVLLSSIELIQCSPSAVSQEKYPFTSKVDLIFAVNRKDCAPKKILTSVIRNAEDRLNIEKYSPARRFIFLVVDDEPRWVSMFLPVLYNIIGQRADIMVTRTYEETLKFLFGVENEADIDELEYRKKGRGDDVVCLITDIFFPWGDNLRSNSGKALINLVDRYYQQFPKIIASKASEADDLKSTAFILPKGDPGSMQTLSDYIHDNTGLGDFLVCTETGKEIHRVKNIRDLYDVLNKAEADTKNAKKLRELLESHGQRDNFSTWLYMHGFRDLGDRLLPKHVKGRRLVSFLKRHLEKEIARVDSTPLIVGEHRINDLSGLLNMLLSIDSADIQHLTDNDYFSIWLDRKGYSELANEMRPVHGSGKKLERTLAELVQKWIKIYQSRQIKF